MSGLLSMEARAGLLGSMVRQAVVAQQGLTAQEATGVQTQVTKLVVAAAMVAAVLPLARMALAVAQALAERRQMARLADLLVLNQQTMAAMALAAAVVRYSKPLAATAATATSGLMEFHIKALAAALAAVLLVEQ
jgi:hypothetical protein